ncbi:MAG: threonine aldolase [Solirubrobacterales bacterium]|nr:threonine aldolase [Solirubrobacterales bacterium]
MEPSRGFASDNCSGVHPDLLAALGRVNQGHVGSYGADPETARLDELARREFGPETRIFPMLNGTGANVAALRAMARPHQAVICPATAHLSIDETAAPEAIAGLKLLNVETGDGKLTPELAAQRLADRSDLPHVAWPVVVSISQSSEVGTVYSPDEVRALADFAHENGMLLHMDGSRLANAAASLGAGLAEASTDCGVDVLCLGANKNGAAFGEAVVFTDPALADGFPVLRKGTLQLASKMRFVSAQLVALLEDDFWREPAGSANAMATALGERAARIDGVELAQPVEANAVFITLDLDSAERFAAACEPHRPLLFSLGEIGVIRLVASWDTTIDDVDGLVAKLASAQDPAPFG